MLTLTMCLMVATATAQYQNFNPQTSGYSYTASYQDGYQGNYGNSYTAPAQTTYNQPQFNTYLTPAQNTYSAPAQNTYSPAPAQNTYSVVPSQNTYSSVPTQNTYSVVPSQNTYSSVPTQNTYSVVPSQNTYSSVPTQNTYSVVPAYSTYTAPAPAFTNTAPAYNTFTAPAPASTNTAPAYTFTAPAPAYTNTAPAYNTFTAPASTYNTYQAAPSTFSAPQVHDTSFSQSQFSQGQYSPSQYTPQVYQTQYTPNQFSSITPVVTRQTSYETQLNHNSQPSYQPVRARQYQQGTGSNGGYNHRNSGRHASSRHVPVTIAHKKKSSKSLIVSLNPGFYVPGGTQLYGNFKDLHSCQKACDLTPVCFAGDFNPWVKKCFMHTNITACAAMSTHPQITHFKKVPCSVTDTPRGRITLGAAMTKGVQLPNVNSFQECLKKCTTMGGGIAATNANAARTPQICFAVDFDFSAHSCYVQVDYNAPAKLCPDAVVNTPKNIVPNRSNVNVLLCPRSLT